MKYYVYVLRSEKDGRRYIGFTNDIGRRLEQHHHGKVGSTASQRPMVLEYLEEHKTKDSALSREKYFKTAAGRKMLKQLVNNKNNAPGWRNLADAPA